MTWSAGTQFHVLLDRLEYGEDTIFLNNNGGPGWGRNQWSKVDVATKHDIPLDAVAIFLQGNLIITNGTAPGDAMLQIWVRPHNAPRYMNFHYTFSHESGTRVPVSFICPIKNGAFDLWWEGNETAPGQSWPVNSAYGINLNCFGFYL